MILNNAISLSESILGDEEIFLEELIPSVENVEEIVLFDDFYRSVLLYKHNLKFEESLVFELKINHFNNKEISKLLDIPYKRVDNCLRRIRGMLSKSTLISKIDFKFTKD